MTIVPVGTPVATRQGQPTGIINGQSIHDTKFATRALAAAPLPVATNFFGAAPVADPTCDRYEQGNALVGSLKVFTIYSMAVKLITGAGATLVDLENLIQKCCIRMVTAQKEYGVWDLHFLRAAGGLSVQSGQIAVTPAAPPGATVTTGAINGMPLDCGFSLSHPLEIQGNQPFYMELLAPSGVGPIAAVTLAGIVYAKLILSGVEDRAAA